MLGATFVPMGRMISAEATSRWANNPIPWRGGGAVTVMRPVG